MRPIGWTVMLAPAGWRSVCRDLTPLRRRAPGRGMKKIAYVYVRIAEASGRSYRLVTGAIQITVTPRSD